MFRLGESDMSTDVLEVQVWAQEFESICERISGYFGRRDLRRRTEGYLRGLLGRIDRKNGWQLAEYRTEFSGCWIGRGGTPMRCETS